VDYEKKIERLNEILNSLDGDNLPLEKSIGLYEEAVAIYKECAEYLQNSKGTVYKIKQELDKFNEEKMK
jgi:exodeoxyribonuclease VII small subunit